MNPTISHFPVKKSRIGFHYYPDTLHYREADLEIWLPELKSLNASWLVIQSSYRRAIPEQFLNGLITAGIEPIIQFNLSLEKPPSIEEIQPLLDVYARNGVNGVIFFDRPNDRIAWQSPDWVQQDLVERFIEQYLPFANQAIQSGLCPIFPPLEPGGSYWDTAFLRSAIESLMRRKQNAILYKLVLSSYAWMGNHHLNWGCGGPQRWTEAKPYFTPPNEEDQRGFRIFEWYSAITQALLHDTIPIILLGAGVNSDPLKTPAKEILTTNHTENNLNIARLLTYENEVQSTAEQIICESIPDYVISTNFWLLNSEASGPYVQQAWYQSDGNHNPIVQVMKTWSAKLNQPDEEYVETTLDKGFYPYSQHEQVQTKSNRISFKTIDQPIKHYLLIPTYEWGISDWHLNVIGPYVKKHMPTVGFSLEEACHAENVTVVGNHQTFSDEQLEKLRKNGCSVERICGDGTSIATQLAER